MKLLEMDGQEDDSEDESQNESEEEEDEEDSDGNCLERRELGGGTLP